MAPLSSPSSNSDENLFPIEQIIFSCSICQAAPSEVYSRTESNHGFHSGSGDDDGIVTKMWIASCSHITCAKHLKSGAIPFHSKDRTPQVVCPRCSKDQGDDSLKDVYAIRGLKKGEFDSIIPNEWLQFPPMKLDTSVPGMGAVRFQYVALSHYARRAKGHWDSAQRKLSRMESALSQERASHGQTQQQLKDLQSKVETLQRSESRLKKWEARKEVIHHTLGQVHDMVKEIDMLRKQLRQLGYAAPVHRYTFQPGHEANGQAMHQTLQNAPQPVPIAAAFTDSAEHRSSSAQKRKRERDDDPEYYRLTIERPVEARASSRELMPPPLPRQQPALRESEPVHYRTTDKHEQNMRNDIVHSQYRDTPAFSFNTAPTRSTPLTTSTRAVARTQEDARFEPPRSNKACVPLSQTNQANTSHPGQQRHPYDDAVHPFSRLAIGSSPQTYTRGHPQPPFRQPITPTRTVGYRHSRPRTHGYNAVYGTDADQIPALHRGVDLNATSRQVGQFASPQRESQMVAPSVTSPFFSRNAAGEVFAHCSSTKAYDRSTPQLALIERPTSEYVRDMGGVTSTFPTQDLHTNSNRFHTVNGRPRLMPPPRTHVGRDSGAAPRQAPHYQATYALPDSHARNYPPGDMVQALQQPAPRLGRISLPPSRNRLGRPRASHDQALSQIVGVRGLTSQRGMPYASAHDSMSGRNLFSTVSSRRSVRR